MASPQHASDEDYNVTSDRRQALIKTLDDKLKELGIDYVSPHFWACCQICNIESLNELMEIITLKPAEDWPGFNGICTAMVNSCK